MESLASRGGSTWNPPLGATSRTASRLYHRRTSPNPEPFHRTSAESERSNKENKQSAFAVEISDVFSL